ncbi:MAG: pyruvate dehydrogenase (acetyl-transferring), homodimeric type [Chloroflexi bacterium]|nr:pyruvate dehydrogenase (acetyl-transferring), homodimeric type [Chloroflexota bacterium]
MAQLDTHRDGVLNGGQGADAVETRDWLDALHDVRRLSGNERVRELLRELQIHAQRAGGVLPVTARTPYANSIPPEREPAYPGDEALEWQIRSIIRWNAMAMVVAANREADGIGGHISTYASAATLYEVGFNHFFRGPDHPEGPDIIYFQGHAAPGIYARAYLEGRLTAEQIHDFRRELMPSGGVSSYPHPWLMPDFWQFPTVSMGLGPLMSIYQARFMRYLEDRGLKQPSDQRVWAFVGDGEADAPETIAAISLAGREYLDNLTWVVNCNLQRLDGPVRGNGNIVQELEGLFRGAGWNVIKVLWGRDWDELFANDRDGLLTRRAGQIVDGEYQKYSVAGGAYIRENFYGVDERLLAMVADRSDDELVRMNLGGHDARKVYAAFNAAVRHKGAPTVVLARTIKGYGLGEAGEGRNVTHQQKQLNEDELLTFRDRFKIPISDEDLGRAPLYRPGPDSREVRYLTVRREELGGFMPMRRAEKSQISTPPADGFAEFEAGSERPASTTMAFVRMLSKLLRDPALGPRVVPIVPDEARTFGMEALFRQVGIYSAVGQLYEPVDSASLLYYKEATDGQILEEGIAEAGAMSSFIAAGTSHATYGVATLPFFIYYSMFGFQRVGDLVWAAADARTRGFLLGATAGRTTLAGEGLQHQDGHSHLLFSVVPTCLAYDPAFAYEIAVIIREGIRRMHEQDEDVFYYLTLGNEAYPHPSLPADDGVREGILKGMYRLRAADAAPGQPRATLLGSGAILNEVLEAQEMLAARYGVAADVWSVTSYTELRREALDADRWNMLHPDRTPRTSYVANCLANAPDVVVAASDYMKSLPDLIAKWVPGRLVALGTDGFGRSDTRAALRDFFEVDARFVTLATLHALARESRIDSELVSEAIEDLGIDAEKPNPRLS